MGDAITFDGQTVPVEPGDTVASALHRHGVRVVGRSMKYHRPRGLYCCTGSCGSCLVDVDGVPNVAACMLPAAAGQVVESQNRLGSARRDLLGVVDMVFRRGFHPHTAFTRPPFVNRLYVKSVRRMSGLGRAPAPDGQEPPRGRFRTRHVHHLVVGAGRNGLDAARRHAHGDRTTLLVEELDRLGGSALWDPTEHGTMALARQALDGAWPGVEAWTGTVAFGVYGDAVALHRGDDVWSITADRITVAPGRHDAWPLFANNDLPGVLSLRGARRLLFGHGVLPGRTVVGHGAPLPKDFVAGLQARGGAVAAEGRVEAVRGGSHVEKAQVGNDWIDCDAVVCHLPGTPRAELFQQAGCRLDFSLGGLGPERDADGATSQPPFHGAFSPPPGVPGGEAP